jgi:hypothetical protein
MLRRLAAFSKSQRSPPSINRKVRPSDPSGHIAGARDEPDLADQLSDGSLDPDKVQSWVEPWDEGSDDEV